MGRHLWLAIALLFVAILALPVPALAVVATEGTFVLPQGGENLTGWVTVLPGRSVHYQTTADGYISYIAEAEGVGTVDGGDGGALSGCLASDHEFHFRLRWVNGQILYARAANVSFQIALEFGTAGCRDLAEAARAMDFGNRAPPGFGITLLAGVLVLAGAVGVAGVAAVLLTRKKGNGTATAVVPPGTPQPSPASHAQAGALSEALNRAARPPR